MTVHVECEKCGRYIENTGPSVEVLDLLRAWVDTHACFVAARALATVKPEITA